MTITEMLRTHRIFLPTRDAQAHMLRVMEFAAGIGRFDALVERINYIACREDEVIVINRDGQPDEMSFFWQQITRAEHIEGLGAMGLNIAYEEELTFLTPKGDYQMPNRKTYHGGLICRKAYTPVTWTVHT